MIDLYTQTKQIILKTYLHNHFLILSFTHTHAQSCLNNIYIYAHTWGSLHVLVLIVRVHFCHWFLAPEVGWSLQLKLLKIVQLYYTFSYRNLVLVHIVINMTMKLYFIHVYHQLLHKMYHSYK